MLSRTTRELVKTKTKPTQSIGTNIKVSYHNEMHYFELHQQVFCWFIENQQSFVVLDTNNHNLTNITKNLEFFRKLKNLLDFRENLLESFRIFLKSIRIFLKSFKIF